MATLAPPGRAPGTHQNGISNPLHLAARVWVFACKPAPGVVAPPAGSRRSLKSMQCLLAISTAIIWIGSLQNTDYSHFEGAVIRPLNTNERHFSGSGGPGSATPERLSLQGTLRDLIDLAYPNTEEHIRGGSGLDEVYLLNAVLPAGATDANQSTMVANLLAERFGLVFHFTTEKVLAYELVVGPHGFHVPPEHEAAPPPEIITASRRLDERTRRVTIHQQPIGALLSSSAYFFRGTGVRLLNRTGIKGKFDITVDLPNRQGPNPGLAPDESGDSRWGEAVEDFANELSLALDRQLGLRLKAVKVDHPVMVIDQIKKLRPEK
jgi:uncharacterized protein (TIGR03435 family)